MSDHRDAAAWLLAAHTVIDFERGTVYDDRVRASTARRAGHRGKAAARPAARRVKSTRAGPDDDPGPADPPWETFAELVLSRPGAST